MFPRRGAIALVTTAIALVLLFNFKTPDQLPVSGGLASTDGSLSTTGIVSGSNGSTGAATTNGSSNGTSASNGTASAGSTAAPSNRKGGTTGTETLTGVVVPSRYGDTQVQV